MNEKINLVEILKDCPKGTEFWSPMLGDVKFIRINKSKIIVDTKECSWEINSDSTVQIDCFTSVEPMLFPSREQRDWRKWVCPKPKKPKFDPKTLQPFDKVLVRDANHNYWCGDILSHINNDKWCDISFCSYVQVIPYNEDTKHLVGTKDEAPEYYRYWKD